MKKGVIRHFVAIIATNVINLCLVYVLTEVEVKG